MISRRAVAICFFFLLFGFFLSIVMRMIEPFFGALLFAAVLAMVFYPMHAWIRRTLPRSSRSFQAFLSSACIFVIFVVPLAFVGWTAIAQSSMLIPKIAQGSAKVTLWLGQSPLEAFPSLNRLPPLFKQQMNVHPTDFQERVNRMTQRATARAGHLTSVVARHTFHFILKLGILLLALFFFLRDGTHMLNRLEQLLPLGVRNTQRLQQKTHKVVVGVVRAMFITSITQGVLACVAFLIIRDPAAFLLGLLCAMAGVVPTVGAALVWLPVSVYYLAIGKTASGFFLIGWGVLVIGTLDHLLRPLLLGASTEISFFWLFLGIVGGLQLFGVKGLLLGPLVMALMPVLLDIYETGFIKPAETATEGETGNDLPFIG